MGALLLVAAGGCTNELQSSLEASLLGEGGKQWAVVPSECASGERQGFFGVDLRVGASGDGLVRAIVDPTEGPILKLNVPGSSEGLNVRPGPSCSQLEIHVERQNSKINNVTNVRGHVRVACKLQIADLTVELHPGNNLGADALGLCPG